MTLHIKLSFQQFTLIKTNDTTFYNKNKLKLQVLYNPLHYLLFNLEY